MRASLRLNFAGLLVLAGALSVGCEGDDLVRLEGALRVRVINASPQAAFIEVLMVKEGVQRTAHETAQRPETKLLLSKVPTGGWDVYASTLDGDATPLESLQVTNVLIAHDATSEVVVDFAAAAVVRIPCEPGDPDIPLCMICVDGEVMAAADDARCGVLDCEPFNWWQLDGDNSAAGTSTCIQGQTSDIDSERCVEPGLCKEPSDLTCPVIAEEVMSAGLCQTIEGCEAGSPAIATAPDGSPCGSALFCQGGQCLPPSPDCVEGVDEPPLCMVCQSGTWAALSDDERCGEIDCSGYETWTMIGDNSAAGSSQCQHGVTASITGDRCIAANLCVTASAATCPASAEIALDAWLCQTIAGCSAGTPSLLTSPDGTPCGGGKVCETGVCVSLSVPEAGCADGGREGFLSLEVYPAIAGCAGAWSVGGVTRMNLAPTCGLAGGDDGANSEGTGCSAADMCASGWHVCDGKVEVGAKAPSGCGDAVPAGTPDKALFFAVAQHSTEGSVCDHSLNSNDVFGCGNLGTALSLDKGCAPLDRVLASTQADTCGFNEAEFPHGPWACLGGTDSHLHEGSLVTKDACPGTSCSYDGAPIGNSDKGGVLCCRD